ncbi:uncharacterized protein LOC116605640 [Nematostella vectensis]|uniref:uncharacterized protein LOC116605640 n=1 Tax=Nematostella vectensis TaxID=45351 RepID=UPI0020776423|nr:uncharacterized protein LOC116605640 [Nematostella vectensis]XP_048587965.1 uncharacterized protein LOC116605640 [Nematostella vectensis]
MDDHANAVLKELHSLQLPWDEVLPQSHVDWLDVFSNAHSVVKEIMFPAILTGISGVMAPRTTIKLSKNEYEPVNLFTVILAPTGAGKTAAMKAAIDEPLSALDESCEAPILIEDFSKSGLFNHLKNTDGMGVLCKDEIHILIKKLLSGKKKELDKDIFIKLFDNGSWTVNKGNSAKRLRLPRVALAMIGFSQPCSFFELYAKMAAVGNGFVDRILCCCPLPKCLSCTDRIRAAASLQRKFGTMQSLENVYQYIYSRHNTNQEKVFTLSQEAFQYFVQEEQKFVDALNAIFACETVQETPTNISKASKLVLRIAASLHVFVDRLSQALEEIPARDTPTVIELPEMKRAFALGKWFMDSRYILEKLIKGKTKNNVLSVQNKMIQGKSTNGVPLQKSVLSVDGPFVTFRLACRASHAHKPEVREAMKKLEEQGLGSLDEDKKVFYKALPSALENLKGQLKLYGVDLADYNSTFCVKNSSLSAAQWKTVMANSPDRAGCQSCGWLKKQKKEQVKSLSRDL